MFSWEAKTPTTQAGSNLLAAHAEAAPGTNQASKHVQRNGRL